MFTALPFKIVIDNRQAYGTNSNFQVQLPETLHLDPDVVMYVNSATVTNTFLSTGTTVGSKSHYVYFYEKNGATPAFNRAQLPERGYVADELADALESAMNLWSASLVVATPASTTRAIRPSPYAVPTPSCW